MIKLLAKLLSKVSTLSAGANSNACVHLCFDEPKCPKSLIEK